MPTIRQEIFFRLNTSAAALVGAIRRRVYDAMRNGKRRGLTDKQLLEEILASLNAFSLPPKQRSELAVEVRRSMREIADARQSVVGSTATEIPDVNRLLALADVTIPKIKVSVARGLRTDLRRAIASGQGVEGLLERLEERGIQNVKTLANTAVAQFNNLFEFKQAEVSGATEFRYDGPVNPKSREFCREHVGKIYTLPEIEAMDNGQGLPVKESCGGWNCRHSWTAVA